MLGIDKPWKRIRVVCGCHEEPIDMSVNERGEHSTFYSCPKYYPENRKPGEKACANRISLPDYENMVTKLSEMIAEAEMGGGKICLTNYAWERKYTQFKVLSHERKEIVVSIVNKKALS